MALVTKRLYCLLDEYEQAVVTNKDTMHYKKKIEKYVESCRKSDKNNILTTWYLRLFDYDVETLRINLTKCIALEPEYVPSKEERMKLLMTLWGITKVLFEDYDYAELFDRVNDHVDFLKKYDDAEESLPFV